MRRHAPGFPGRGRMPPAVFLPSPPPQGGGRAFSVQKRGTSRGLPAIRWPPQGGQPLSFRKRDGDGVARRPLAPRRGASLFPFRKGTAMGVPPSVSPPQGGQPLSFQKRDGDGGAGVVVGGALRLLSRRLPPFGAAGGAAQLPRPKSTGFPGSEYSPRPGRPCWAAPRRWCWCR